MGVRDGKIDYAVIGVGINVNIREFPAEMEDKATSLYLESGREFDRSQIPGLVMEAFENYYEKFAATCNLSGLKAEYESILANYNQPVRVLAKEPYEGIARGITDSGGAACGKNGWNSSGSQRRRGFCAGLVQLRVK